MSKPLWSLMTISSCVEMFYKTLSLLSNEDFRSRYPLESRPESHAQQKCKGPFISLWRIHSTLSGPDLPWSPEFSVTSWFLWQVGQAPNYRDVSMNYAEVSTSNREWLVLANMFLFRKAVASIEVMYVWTCAPCKFRLSRKACKKTYSVVCLYWSELLNRSGFLLAWAVSRCGISHRSLPRLRAVWCLPIRQWD